MENKKDKKKYRNAEFPRPNKDRNGDYLRKKKHSMEKVQFSILFLYQKSND